MGRTQSGGVDISLTDPVSSFHFLFGPARVRPKLEGELTTPPWCPTSRMNYRSTCKKMAEGAKEKRKRGKDYLAWGAVGGLSDVWLVVVLMEELMAAVGCWRMKKKVCGEERNELDNAITTWGGRAVACGGDDGGQTGDEGAGVWRPQWREKGAWQRSHHVRWSGDCLWWR